MEAAMKIVIDGRNIEVTDSNLNIVDIAAENGIGIPAPCYKVNRKFGCCNGCAILINGEIRYACTVKPKQGMDIKVNTEELIALRKANLKKYQDAIKTGEKLECKCDCDCGDDSDSDSGCGCGDGCC